MICYTEVDPSLCPAVPDLLLGQAGGHTTDCSPRLEDTSPSRHAGDRATSTAP